MPVIIPLNILEVIPDKKAVLRQQGVPDNFNVRNTLLSLAADSIEIFKDNAKPSALLSEVSVIDFESVFIGEGQNADDCPIKKIFPQADKLALFVLTMGEHISRKIERLFIENDFAFASMLDAAASLAADRSTEILAQYFYKYLKENNPAAKSSAVLSYSPGYCGWHISGQKKLFDYLKPENIGITLNNNYLMSPIKSVSGVLIAGEKGIHIFKSGFDFCESCMNRSCTDRIKRLQEV